VYGNDSLNRELTAITMPNEVAAGGRPTIQYVYDSNANSPTAGMVTQVTQGGTNGNGVAAGGTIQYQYQVIGSPGPGDFTTPRYQTTVTDRNGNQVQYQFNQLGNIVDEKQYNNRDLRPSDPAFYETRYTYNGDYLMLSQTNPLGNIIQYTYDPGVYTLQSGTSTGSNTATTLNDTSQSWVVNEWRYESVLITGGTGAGQSREITSNTATQLTVNMAWTMTPDTTSTYQIEMISRMEQGNLLSEIQTADAARGGDQTAITTTYTYEPIYNQILTLTEPRGNDPNYVPQNGGTNSPARYTTIYTYDYQEGTDFAGLATQIGGGISAGAVQALLAAHLVSMNLGDINQDGTTSQINGNLIRRQDPTVNLLPGSNQATVEGNTQQPIVTLYTYNIDSQMTSQTDPEGNVTQYMYYPENDPAGTGNNYDTNPNPSPFGGYLKQTITDSTSNPDRDSGTNPTPARITVQYRYDDVGNMTQQVDGRGITTQYVYNQANQLVEKIDAAAVPGTSAAEPLPLTAFSYLTRYFYDYNGNQVLVETEDRGNTSNVQGNLPPVDMPVVNIQVASTSTGSNSATTLNDTTQHWTINQWAGFAVRIISGLGVGQFAAIVSNTANQLTVSPSWSTIPNSSSHYVIYPILNPDPVGGPTAFAQTAYQYDLLNQELQMVQEVSGGPNPVFLTTRYRYDANGNQVLLIMPEGNASASVYDERDLLFQSTMGATSPPPFALLGPRDPSNYLVRGGLASTTTYNYDLNGNLNETDSSDDIDGSLANNSKLPSGTSTGGNTSTTLNDANHTWMTNQWQGRTVLIQSGTGAGELAVVASNTAHQLVLTTAWVATPDSTSVYVFQGDRTRYVYDGFDRRTAVVDSVGNETVTQYDPNSDVVRSLDFGPVGGASPLVDGPDTLKGPVSSLGVIQTPHLVNPNLLAATESSYDELGRVYQTSQVLFINTIVLMHNADVAEGGSSVGLGDLTPGQTQGIPGLPLVNVLGRVSERTEYDRDSRVTFQVEDDLNTTRTFYDGVGRVIKTMDNEGNTVETAYDGGSNVIETRETDVSQIPGVPNEIFLTTNFYDSLDRLQMTVDNLGHTSDYRYDSRGNLVAMADAQGPLTGSITRRAFPDGPLTVDAINGYGNVTRYYYDGIDRKVREEQILTTLPGTNGSTASGDGVHIGASIYGVKDDPSASESFPPTADTNQGGGDGIIRTGYVYDQNSNLSAMIDDNGNVTIYLYDDLDRKVAQSQGLITGSTLTNSNLFGAVVINTPTEATLNHPAFIVAGLVNKQLAEIAAGLTAVASLFPALASQINDHPPQTAMTGYDPNGDVLIKMDENNSYTYTKYDGIDRAIAVRIFRNGQHDSFAGDAQFAPAPVSLPTHHTVNTTVVGTNIMNFQYDGLSRMTMSFDNGDPSNSAEASTVTDGYDSLSRVVEETQTTDSQATQDIDMGWRAASLRSSLTYPSGRVEVYTYDHLDRVASVADQGASQDIADYKYIGVDRVLERIYPQNGTVETYLDNSGTTDIGYDGDRRIVEMRDLRSDNSLIVGFVYTYDRVDNVLTQTKLHDTANNEQYSYDAADRLISFVRLNAGAIAPAQSSWKLDGVGNWTSVDTETRKYTSTNELISRTMGPSTTNLTYDDNGNETSDGTYRYAYDARNRLRTVTRMSDNALIAVYSYDADNRRTSSTITNSGSLNGTTYFYLDGQQEIEEHSTSGALTQQYVYGIYIDEAVVLDRNLNGDNDANDTSGDQRLFYYQDRLYSVYALADTSANIVEGYQYDAYGRQTVFDPGVSGVVTFTSADHIAQGGSSQVANPYLFTGRRLDPENQLYYYRARFYDSTEGRFLSRDPLSQMDQTVAYPLSPTAGSMPGVPLYYNNRPDYQFSSDSLYSYTSENPLARIDPYGLKWGIDESDAKINTIVCDGKGGIEVQIGTANDAEALKCTKGCIEAHERSHMADALAFDKNICKDVAKGRIPGFLDQKERSESEIKASNVEITCLEAELKKCPAECKDTIKRRIKQMEEYRDGFKAPAAAPAPQPAPQPAPKVAPQPAPRPAPRPITPQEAIEFDRQFPGSAYKPGPKW
jgi:RHS repeat-associated protein